MGGSIGRDSNGDPFYEVGGTTPGVSAAGYYVYTVPWLSTCFQSPPPQNQNTGTAPEPSSPPQDIFGGRNMFMNNSAAADQSFFNLQLLSMFYDRMTNTLNMGDLGTVTVYPDGTQIYHGPMKVQ